MDHTWLADARPHLRRAAIYTVVAIAGLIAASSGSIRPLTEGSGFAGNEREVLTASAGALLLLVAGIAAVRAAARAARAISSQKVGDTRGAALGLLIQNFGYFIVVLTVLGLLSVNVSGLLLGGAITGVVVGIAAQQTLANFFAGLVIISVRPLEVGERVVLRSGPLGGEYEGVVTDMGMFYVDMVTDNGPVKLPNAGVLASAIGPGARAPANEDAPIDEDTVDRPRRET
ncbi:MAG: mechanosensitive ion channel domain-containing protein [Actinomycetota bacterium]